MRSELRYCYDCFDWFVEEEWEEHCLIHLNSITSKLCGSIYYCNVLLRPFFCSFCIGTHIVPAASRWKSWTREDKLREHLDAHLDISRWPRQCPHPLCGLQINNERSFLYHLSDSHSLRTRQLEVKRGQKQANLGTSIDWTPKAVNQKRNRKDADEPIFSRHSKRPKNATLVKDGLKEISSIPQGSMSISETSELAFTPSISPLDTDVLPSKDDFDFSGNGQQGQSHNTRNWSNCLSETSADGSMLQPDEDALFAQFLRSRSPSCLRNDTVLEYSKDTAASPHITAPQNLCLVSKDRALFDHHIVDLKNPVKAKPRITLRLSQPKPNLRPKTLRLKQPKRKSNCKLIRQGPKRKV